MEVHDINSSPRHPTDLYGLESHYLSLQCHNYKLYLLSLHHHSIGYNVFIITMSKLSLRLHVVAKLLIAIYTYMVSWYQKFFSASHDIHISV